MGTSLKEIASRIGVSHATVSMALRDNPEISSARREQIKKVAHEMGYKPNLLSRGLRGGRTRSIGILWSIGGAPQSGQIVQKIALQAMQHKYVSYTVNSLCDPEIIKTAIDDFLQRHVDGLIWQCYPPERFTQEICQKILQFPAAVIVCNTEIDIPFDLIHHDRTTAICSVVDHFVASGRRYPMIIAPSDSRHDKIDIFINRLRYHQIEVSHKNVIVFPLVTEKSIGRHFLDALEAAFPHGYPPFDGLFCSPDEGALASIRWLKNRGLRVPQDVAVVGFDNNDFTEFCDPPLASIRPCSSEMVSMIETMLFSRLDDSDLPPRTQRIPMQFVWRESAGKTR